MEDLNSNDFPKIRTLKKTQKKTKITRKKRKPKMANTKSKARKMHKKVDKRFKKGVRSNNKMKIKSGPNGKKSRKKKK